MKKLVFSAMVSIAFVGSAFASNELINQKQLSEDDSVSTVETDDKRPCSFRAAVIEKDGRVYIKEGNVSRKECKEAADNWAATTHQITPIIEGSLDVVWGDRI